jgi:hypothetical protein
MEVPPMGNQINTVLDAANIVSNMINGNPASANYSPTKQQIYSMLNAAEDAICTSTNQFSFLRKTATIQGCELTQGFLNQSLGNTVGTQGTTALLPVTTDTTPIWIATSYTQPVGEPCSIGSVTFGITPSIQGFGNLQGSFQAQIWGYVGQNSSNPSLANPTFTKGMPDSTNVLGTSTPLVILNSTYQGSVYGNPATITLVNGQFTPLSLTFTTPVLVEALQEVYVVLEWIPNAYNAATFSYTTLSGNNQNVCYGPQTLSTINPPTLAPNSFSISINTNNMTYIVNQVEMPSDARWLARIYNPLTGIYMKPYPYTAIIENSQSFPTPVFSVVGSDPVTGTLLANLYLGTGAPSSTYLVDYVASPKPMVLDTDVPIIPSEFRMALVWKALEYLYNANYGIPMSLDSVISSYNMLLQKIRENYLPAEDTSFSVLIGGLTDNIASALRDYTTTSQVTIQPTPNTWQESPLGGRPGGGWGAW